MKHIKELRKEKGMNQQDLCAELEIDKSTLIAWEKGTREPGADMIRKLASVLSCSTDYLIGMDETRNKGAEYLVEDAGYTKDAAEKLATIPRHLVPVMCDLVADPDFIEYLERIRAAEHAAVSWYHSTGDQKAMEEKQLQFIAANYYAGNLSGSMINNICKAKLKDQIK